MKWSFRIVFNWIGLRWPGLFIPACSVFGCTTLGRAWALVWMLPAIEAASEGVESCCLLAALLAARVPSPSMKSVLDGKLHCQPYVSAQSLNKDNLYCYKLFKLRFTKDILFYCENNKWAKRVLIALESGRPKLESCFCLLFTVSFIFSISKVRVMILISWDYCTN